MNRRLGGLALGFALVLALRGSAPGGAGAAPQVETAIDLDPAIECWFHDEFPQLDATFDPASDIARSRLYFRCTSYSDYYFVDLESQGAAYRGVAPKAEEDCPDVAYYVEVVRNDFTSDRTVERTAPVTSHTECRRRYPGVAFFTGSPSLRVGSTAQTLTQLVGFKMDGVTTLLSAGGQVTVGGGGGLSGPAIGAIAAGAGGAVALGLAASGDDGSSPPPVASGSTTTTTTTTTIPATPPPGSPVKACIEVDPEDAVILAGGSIRLDGRCSTGEGLAFEWNLGDGRIREGNFINPTYPNPGNFEVTLTVTQASSGLRSRTRLRWPGGDLQEDVVDTASVRVSVLEALTACFTVQDISPGSGCNTAYNGGCSKGDIVRYEWLLDTGNVSGRGPVPGSGIDFKQDWSRTPACPSFGAIAIGVRLTVFDGSGRSNTVERSTNVTYLTSPHYQRTTVAASFTSYLGVPPFDGRVSGQVLHNGQGVDLVTNQSPARHQLDGRLGTNSLEAFTTTPLESPGYWRFDFHGTPDFVPRSLRVVSGQVLSQDDYTVVFRVSGEQADRIRFTYQLVP